MCKTLVLLVCLLIPLIASATEPVDTVQFGALQPGMFEQEILSRLGEPSSRLEQGTTKVRVRTAHGLEVQERRRYQMIYIGDARVMDTILVMEDGILVDKVKRAHSGVR